MLEDKNSDIISKYKVLYEAVVENLLEGSLMKNSAKVQDDFYLTIFHPINDYSLQVCIKYAETIIEYYKFFILTDDILSRCIIQSAFINRQYISSYRDCRILM